MKADSWILRKLPEYLVNDWYDLNIYTEFDLQAATYFWLRKYFERDRSLIWITRLQPLLRLNGESVKPDIVIYKNTIPYDAIEIKCQLFGFNRTRCEKDLNKLRKLKKELKIRHAYQIVLYDDDEVMAIPSYFKAAWMKRYLTFVGANVRRHNNGRKRRDYDLTRKRWERFR